jgi:hypothetical protein
MIEDKIGKVMGCVKYEAYNAKGKLVYYRKHDFPIEHNTVCDLYYDLLADRMAGGADTLITHGHCGTGNGQVATDTNLSVPCAEARTAIDSKTQGAGANLHKVTVITTYGAGICTGNLEECGLFSNANQATADMKLYDDSLSYAKGAGDTLVVTWVITHSN